MRVFEPLILKVSLIDVFSTIWPFMGDPDLFKLRLTLTRLLKLCPVAPLRTLVFYSIKLVLPPSFAELLPSIAFALSSEMSLR